MSKVFFGWLFSLLLLPYSANAILVDCSLLFESPEQVKERVRFQRHLAAMKLIYNTAEGIVDVLYPKGSYEVIGDADSQVRDFVKTVALREYAASPYAFHAPKKVYVTLANPHGKFWGYLVKVISKNGGWPVYIRVDATRYYSGAMEAGKSAVEGFGFHELYETADWSELNFEVEDKPDSLRLIEALAKSANQEAAQYGFTLVIKRNGNGPEKFQSVFDLSSWLGRIDRTSLYGAEVDYRPEMDLDNVIYQYYLNADPTLTREKAESMIKWLRSRTTSYIFGREYFAPEIRSFAGYLESKGQWEAFRNHLERVEILGSTARKTIVVSKDGSATYLGYDEGFGKDRVGRVSSEKLGISAPAGLDEGIVIQVQYSSNRLPALLKAKGYTTDVGISSLEVVADSEESLESLVNLLQSHPDVKNFYPVFL
jgi:hypothetical protein